MNSILHAKSAIAVECEICTEIGRVATFFNVECQQNLTILPPRRQFLSSGDAGARPLPQRQRAVGLDFPQRKAGVQILDVGQVGMKPGAPGSFVYHERGICLRGVAMRQVGSRREPKVAVEASGILLAEGARFNELIAWLAPTTFVPKGLYRFRTHEEANRHAQDCLAMGMGLLAAQRA